MSLLSDLLNLNLSDTTEKVIAEYIWAIHGVALLVGFLLWRDTDMIGGSGMDLRSKARTLNGPVRDPSELPNWNYDGSNPNLAPGEDGDLILRPQAIFKDPFRKGNNILVMCDTYTPAGEPILTNKRHAAAKIFSHPGVVAEEPWYTIQQGYTLLHRYVKGPMGWPVGVYPGPQGPYYNGIIDEALGRDVVASHYKACLYAGINISEINGEVMPGQWEVQVGPAMGISAGDGLWVARYILERITEIAGIVLSFDPKPIQGDRNRAGGRTNYSTKSMRNDGGHEAVKKAIERIELRRKEQIRAYYFTERHETADINTFLSGFVSRGASIGVRRDTEEAGNGYLEYRRPASNMDPYVVTSLIAETTILWKPWYHSALEVLRGVVG